MHDIRVLSINHNKAGLSIREKFTLDLKEAVRLMSALKKDLDITEVIALTTCNRTEIYYVAEFDLSKEILETLCSLKKIPASEKYDKYFSSYNENTQSVDHIFNVCLGLDSQVFGDKQVTKQVKDAYNLAVENGFGGYMMHTLMRYIFIACKRVSKETAFRTGSTSVPYFAANMAHQFCHEFSKPVILVIGLGDTGIQVCRDLHKLGYKNVHVVNRTFHKSKEIAGKYGFVPVPFSELERYLKIAHVVISSVRSSEAVVKQCYFKKLMKGEKKYLIDLSVPRSIDELIKKIPGLNLFDIDFFHSKILETMNKRMSSLEHVNEIKSECMYEFFNHYSELDAFPVIKKFKSYLVQIQREEIERMSRKIADSNSDHMYYITDRLIRRIVKNPSNILREVSKHDEFNEMSSAFKKIFSI